MRIPSWALLDVKLEEGWSQEEIDLVNEEAQSSNYDHLVATIVKTIANQFTRMMKTRIKTKLVTL